MRGKQNPQKSRFTFSKFANQCNGDLFSNNIVCRQTGGIKILEMAQSNLLLYYEAEIPTEKQNSMTISWNSTKKINKKH